MNVGVWVGGWWEVRWWSLWERCGARLRVVEVVEAVGRRGKVVTVKWRWWWRGGGEDVVAVGGGRVVVAV